mmetsp:Transcript_4050/g.12803  ORF Transcript_4050/g.12803 Transcript_4050/m.12803 type:complete len:589 (-) Transcript_4050:80-1846(-)
MGAVCTTGGMQCEDGYATKCAILRDKGCPCRVASDSASFETVTQAHWCADSNEGLSGADTEAVSVCQTTPCGQHGVVQQGCTEALTHVLSRSSESAAVLAAALPFTPKMPRMPMAGESPLSVAVIGGGVAGLLTAKWMRQEGFNVVIFEASTSLGGIWAEGSSRLYPTLHSNTSRAWMHFSDFEFPPPDAGSTYFPHHSAITAQVQAYVRHFRLGQLAELGSRVERVSETADGYTVTVNGCDRHFDRVCLCNGKLQEPVVPDVETTGAEVEPSLGILLTGTGCRPAEKPGSLSFHSSRLGGMGPNVFTGRHVIVVGFGQGSGADVCELAAAQGAASVTVVVEKPIFLVPRLLDGRPSEENITLLAMLQPQLTPLLVQLPVMQMFPRTAQGFVPGVHSPTRVWTLHEMIAQGRVNVRQARVTSYEDGIVSLSDGGRFLADVVVWCTGYKSRALDILEPELRARFERAAPLYEGMWAPGVPGMVAIGHDESVWYLIEMQTRWAARVWSGIAPPLPDPVAMWEWIGQRRAEQSMLRPHARREPPLLSVPGDAMAKLMRMAELADLWPSPSQVAMRLLSTFEPRFTHGDVSR